MKAFLLYFALATSVATSDPSSPMPSPAPPMLPPPPSANNALSSPPVNPAATSGQPATPSVSSGLPASLSGPSAQPADPAAPSAGFPASRYEALWTKSPFAVATSEDATVTSPDYMLVGVSNIGGVFYASVIEKQNQEHFLVSSDKPTGGMTLTAINRSHDDTGTYAVVQKDGQSLTLKLEQAPTAQPGGDVVANAPPGQGQIMTPQISMPGAPQPGAPFTARFHRPLINLPPRPGQQPFQPVQVHQTPPPAHP